ncbi:chromodomain-helicase-DNA-binding protein 7 [Nematocida displodere]|uniref:Chromodomain-helicase-DNA-binding protein 7 n=1 Tax=Nematocida displodere TaxID=1805483 RepID=A0A177EDA7_9MICR|nr:chromodomain-helicase-DNA-binding protein 7 [Nematocida displodere]
MQRELSTPSDNSTDLQDTSGTSSFEESDSIEESEELNRGKKSGRGRPRKHSIEEDSVKRAYFGENLDTVENLLKGLEKEVDVTLNTPLTAAEHLESVGTVGMRERLHGGRIMLPLSPFLKPRIHFPVAPIATGSGEIRADIQEKVYNHQYINKGLASTIQYQMYLNNLILMNKMSVAEKKAVVPPKQPKPAKVREVETETEIEMFSDGDLDLPLRQRRRVAAVKRNQSQDDIDPETVSEEEEEGDQDNVEKILAHRESEDLFYIKYRGKSYLHCEWVTKALLAETKIGEMRVKRFLKAPTPLNENELYDPELIMVERVIAEEEEILQDGIKRKIYLIKWKKFPYESSTFEYYDHVCDCDGFEQAHGSFIWRREKAHVPSTPLTWRPSKDRIPENPVFKEGRALRGYQKEGVSWLINKWLFRQSCILADEMGLGKTVQSVTFIDTIITRCSQRRPALVVAPLSTIPHWEREFAAWTDLRVLVYHGSQPAREIMADFEFKRPSGAVLFDVILTTYEMAIAGIDHLSGISFGVSVLDEAHRLKNSKSKAAQTLREIEIDHKVLLSGTPLQNNLGELWSLLNFIDPEKFFSLKQFLGAHKMEEADDVERIQALLKPIMLRRMKDDVESIPVKEETIVEVELTMIQKRFYRAILEKNIEFLSAAGSSTPNLLNIMMELRKCCIHPYLITGAEEQILLENGQDKEPDSVEKDEYFRILIQSSGKLVFLDKLLKKLHGKHKVLVFSQMTRCLDLISDYLQYRGYVYERIDGTVRGDVRQASIDRFSTEKDSFVFLLCTRAGGVGINLTAADTVIIFDSDWNPQNDLQAQARCHRIGQTAEVKIYRLVTRNTYEREMFDRASMKLGLDRAILHKDKEKETATGKKGRVESLLKKGAYGVLMETDDVNKQFCDEDIDSILEGRTKVVRHEDNSGNIFSKASFQVAEEIDDPDFWDNLLVKRRAADAESRLRRVLRKMSKAGLMTSEEEEERLALIQASEDPQDKIDLLVELRGTQAPGLSLDEVSGTIKRALSNVEEPPLREDMAMGLEWAVHLKEALPVATLHPEISPHRLLFRCQVTELLKPYQDARDNIEIDWKQWSHEDDDLLIAQTQEYGYGLYHISVDEKTRVGLLKSDKGKELAVYRGRTKDELSARVRKILAHINKKEEAPEEKVSVSAAIEMFGRPTQANRESIVKMFKGRNIITEMTSMIGTIEENMKRRQTRRSGFDAELAKVLTTRIALFDKLASLIEAGVPAVRKTSGLPRGWGKEKDTLMAQMLLNEGISKDICDSLSITEESMIRRAEALVRNTPAKGEE